MSNDIVAVSMADDLIKKLELNNSQILTKVVIENMLAGFQKQNLRYPDVVKFFIQAKVSNANPLMNQIYLIPKGGSGLIVYSYHHFLNVANTTGEVEGLQCTCNVEDIFHPIKKDFEKELVATAIVKRKGREATVFKARWSEFYISSNPMWNSKSYVMLQKCAIANCLRWVFPEALSGMFIKEEMDNEEMDEQIQQNNTQQKNIAIVAEVKELASKMGEVFDPDCYENRKNFIQEIRDLATKEFQRQGLKKDNVDSFFKEIGIIPVGLLTSALTITELNSIKEKLEKYIELKNKKES